MTANLLARLRQLDAEATRRETSWLWFNPEQRTAIISALERLETVERQLAIAIPVIENFANEWRWYDIPGRLQWIGKMHAIEYAKDALEQIGDEAIERHRARPPETQEGE